MIVVIPAYQPDERLLEIIDALRDEQHRILVVDDGSGPTYDAVFEAAASRRIELLRLPANRGKGRALKVGLRRVIERWPGEDVVTVDSDGQHRPADVLLVANDTAAGDALVLGSRAFVGEVPARSRFGNTVARMLFRASGGQAISDTQTGLRGIPAGRLREVIRIPGERFEWEMNVLLAFSRRRFPIREVPIATVYLDGNASSHFRPLRDSVAVLGPMLRYVAVGMGSFLLELLALYAFFLGTEHLLLSTVCARVLSAVMNFTLNRRFVFRAGEGGNLRGQFLRYAGLSLFMLAAGYGGLALLVSWGFGVVAAKVVTDTGLFVCGYLVQRSFVFAAQGRKAAAVSGEIRGP